MHETGLGNSPEASTKKKRKKEIRGENKDKVVLELVRGAGGGQG